MFVKIVFCRWSIDLFCVVMVPVVSVTLGVDGSTIATEFCFKKSYYAAKFTASFSIGPHGWSSEKCSLCACYAKVDS